MGTPDSVPEPLAGLLRTMVATAKPQQSDAEAAGRSSEQHLRQQLFEQLSAPLAVPWLDGLRLWLIPETESGRALLVDGRSEPDELD